MSRNDAGVPAGCDGMVDQATPFAGSTTAVGLLMLTEREVSTHCRPIHRPVLVTYVTHSNARRYLAHASDSGPCHHRVKLLPFQ